MPPKVVQAEDAEASFIEPSLFAIYEHETLFISHVFEEDLAGWDRRTSLQLQLLYPLPFIQVLEDAFLVALSGVLPCVLELECRRG